MLLGHVCTGSYVANHMMLPSIGGSDVLSGHFWRKRAHSVAIRGPLSRFSSLEGLKKPWPVDWCEGCIKEAEAAYLTRLLQTDQTASYSYKQHVEQINPITYMDDHMIMDVNVSKSRESPPLWGDRWREQLRCALRHISCWLAGQCPRLRMLSLLSLFQADVVRASSCSFVQLCSMGNDSEHHHNTCDQLTAGRPCIKFKMVKTCKDSRSVGIVGRSYMRPWSFMCFCAYTHGVWVAFGLHMGISWEWTWEKNDDALLCW